jgi:competence protein ComFC
MMMLKDLLEEDYCLVCQSLIDTRFGWAELLSPVVPKVLCESCQGKLQRVQGQTCKICGRPFKLLDTQYHKGELCFDCIRWEEDGEYKDVLKQNYSLYVYNDFLQEILAKYKYRGDYVLAKIFAVELKEKINLIKPDHIIPIPLSNERLYERGFNQAEALIVEAGFQPQHVLTRIHGEKQSKKTRNERIKLPQVFQAIKPLGGTIIIMDDIYTTGSTLRHAAKELKKAGDNHIFSITIARG